MVNSNGSLRPYKKKTTPSSLSCSKRGLIARRPFWWTDSYNDQLPNGFLVFPSDSYWLQSTIVDPIFREGYGNMLKFIDMHDPYEIHETMPTVIWYFVNMLKLIIAI